MLKSLKEILQTALLSLLVFAALQVTIQNFRVEGSSMEQTLQSGQWLLVNKLVYYHLDAGRLAHLLPFLDLQPGEDKYLFHPPRRGEVIVFRYPLDPTRDFVKRVIAVPGDTVEIRDGDVFVNGRLLQEPYMGSMNPRPLARRMLGPEEYFVMGDNRSHSNDSKDWGPVTMDHIIGRAWVAYWPFADWKLF
ncbi:MAG: signal peptidase I [Chloroflexi bacterium]|nr:signal peptidase I [Chloroflexota bacterium]